jgi:hypothetical protein
MRSAVIKFEGGSSHDVRDLAKLLPREAHPQATASRDLTHPSVC